MAIKKPWVEAHRPQVVQDIIFNNLHTRTIFLRFVHEQQFPNLLIHGPKGTGKTSVSYALTRECDVDEMDVLKINCSDEKIDAMRSKVVGFALSAPLNEFKVVRLEEIDYLSQDAQALLRSLMEEVSGSCRFIATCNYLNKVLPPLQDRFHIYHFDAPDRDAMLLRAADILDGRQVVYDVEDVDRVVAACYPSMRKVLHVLEANSGSGKLILNLTDASADWKLALLPLLEAGNIKGARKLVCESATREEMQDVYRFLYENIHRCPKLKGLADEAIVLIARYQYQHAFVADTEINAAALLIELEMLK